MAAEERLVLTVRLIRSFEHRNVKHIIYKDVQKQQTIAEFKAFINTDIQTRAGLPPPCRKFAYDTMKISHVPFGAKSSDPVINRDNDETLILQDDKTFEELKIVSETELSYFKLDDYLQYKISPILVW